MMLYKSCLTVSVDHLKFLFSIKNINARKTQQEIILRLLFAFTEDITNRLRKYKKMKTMF
jgi:hypothetical protein